MTDSRLLREAVLALQNVEAEHQLAAGTEQRVLTTVRTKAARARWTRQILGSVLLCSLAAGGAHAAVYGPARTWQLFVSADQSAEHNAPRAAPRNPHLTPTAAPTPILREPPADAPSEPERAPPVATKMDHKVARARAVPEVESDINALAATETSDVLYEDAHRLHFELGDKHAALAAWERYLAAAPDGSFAPEAHYNRALCLLALHRNGEAAEALRAIVTSAQAPYRAGSAARLLRALESSKVSETGR